MYSVGTRTSFAGYRVYTGHFWTLEIFQTIYWLNGMYASPSCVTLINFQFSECTNFGILKINISDKIGEVQLFSMFLFFFFCSKFSDWSSLTKLRNVYYYRAFRKFPKLQFGFPLDLNFYWNGSLSNWNLYWIWIVMKVDCRQIRILSNSVVIENWHLLNSTIIKSLFYRIKFPLYWIVFLTIAEVNFSNFNNHRKVDLIK